MHSSTRFCRASILLSRTLSKRSKNLACCPVLDGTYNAKPRLELHSVNAVSELWIIVPKQLNFV